MSYRSNQDPEENLPDWLKDLRKRQSLDPSKSESDDPETSEKAGQEDEPGWLNEIRERYGLPAAKPGEPAFQKPEIPLSDTQPIHTRKVEEAFPEDLGIEPTKQAFLEEPEPEALEDIHPQEHPTENPPEMEKEQDVPRRDFPDWLQDLSALGDESEKPGGDPSRIPAFTEDTEDLTPGELPSWLEAIRPSGTVSEKRSGKEEIEPSREIPEKEELAGPLAGLSGILPVEPEALLSVKPPIYTTRLELSESQNQHVAALKKLLEEEGKSRENASRQGERPARLLNLFISTALFLAVLFPLFNQSQIAPGPETNALPAASEVFNLIDILPTGAPVLVAMELQPAFLGETKTAATAVLTHLLNRETRLVFISSQPTGPATAEYLLHEELSTEPAIATGDYINLGYISGGMAALRSFLQDPRSATFSISALGLNPWADPALESINQVSDFALVVVVSGSAEDVRVWIEQGAEELPNGLVAVTSAQAAPLLQPYIQSQPQTLKGLLSGMQGAVFYEYMRAQDGDGRVMWDAYSYGLGAISLLILLGGLYGRLIHTRPDQSAGSAQTTTNAEATGSQSAT